jgi:hypothetical protein
VGAGLLAKGGVSATYIAADIAPFASKPAPTFAPETCTDSKAVERYKALLCVYRGINQCKKVLV